MPRKKEEWITSAEAASILSVNSNRTISTDYVRLLAKNGKIESKMLDGRTKLFNKADVEDCSVKPRGDGSVRRRVRKDARERVTGSSMEVDVHA